MSKRWKWVVFLTVSLAIGLVFWWQADWWAYVEDSIRGRYRKFQAPLWVQLFVSSVIGAFFGGVAVGLFVVTKSTWSALTRRSDRPAAISAPRKGHGN